MGWRCGIPAIKSVFPPGPMQRQVVAPGPSPSPSRRHPLFWPPGPKDPQNRKGIFLRRRVGFRFSNKNCSLCAGRRPAIQEQSQPHWLDLDGFTALGPCRLPPFPRNGLGQFYPATTRPSAWERTIRRFSIAPLSGGFPHHQSPLWVQLRKPRRTLELSFHKSGLAKAGHLPG